MWLNHCNALTPKDSASQYIGSQFFGHESPAVRARELFKSSTNSASIIVKIEKNIFRFRFRVGSLGGPPQVGDVFTFFWPPLAGLGPQIIGPFFWLKIFLETRPKSVSLEPLNDFLAGLWSRSWSRGVGRIFNLRSRSRRKF